jgi:hypothetical protein
VLQKITAEKQYSVIHNEKSSLYRSLVVVKIVRTRGKLWARPVDRVGSQKIILICVIQTSVGVNKICTLMGFTQRILVVF